MKIEFNMGDLTEVEARSLVAMFRERFPNIGAHWRHTAPASQVIAQSTNIPEWAVPAPDGYPTPAGMEVDTDVSPPRLVEPPAPPSNVLPAAERDADGILWDERIHTSNKSTKQDGTWKRKPGLDDAYFTSVMAELKAANTARTLEAASTLVGNATAVTPFVPAVPVAPTTSTPVAPSEPTAAEAFTPPASVVIPAHVPAPPVPSVPTPPPAPTGDVPSFPQLIQRITPLQAAGKIDAAKLAELLGAVGLKSIADLVSASADARSNFAALLDTVQ